jgi:tetratricopeptide (TPR) repeat protein
LLDLVTKFLAVAGAVAILTTESRAGAALSGGPRLAAVYDMILSAQFDQARDALTRTCPPAPPEACRALGVVAAWWQIQLDPNSRALDGPFTQTADQSVAAAGSWTRREPGRAEAWFYLAGSYAPLVQWRVGRGQRIAAARDGNRIRAALARARAIDPTLDDAYFGIGLYHYYADVVPAAIKILRRFLLLPGGDRRQGLEEMLQAREHGELLTGEADYQLHWIYLWYEQNPRRALELLRGLDARYPSNPIFLRRVAQVEAEYFHDHAASLATWDTLRQRAGQGRVSAAALAEIDAELGMSDELIALGQPARAVDHLQVVVSKHARQPYSAEAVAQLRLGEAYDQLSQHERATAAYRAAVALAPADDPLRVRARANLRKKF